MPQGGDECIRNSLVCKKLLVWIVSTMGRLPAWEHLLSLSCRMLWKACSRGRWTLLGPRWPLGSGTRLGLRSLWKRILRSCPGIPEDALLCHMKTTPDDPAQLPGATEEIVLGEGVGLARSFLLGKQRVFCLRLTLQPARQPPRTAAACRHGRPGF